MNVHVSAHAADRFAERVRPGLSRREAGVELARLVREFGRVVEWPGWIVEGAGLRRDGQFPVELCDGVLVVCGVSDGRAAPAGRWVALTVVVRCGSPEGHEHRGASRRKRRRARRVAGPNHLDKAARPAVRLARERPWDEAA